MSLAAEFDHQVITFPSYMHPSASVSRNPVLAATRIRDVDSVGYPPEIRTTTGETLFVAKEFGPELAAFAERNGIAEVRRPGVWNPLLEPFLDTSFDKSDDDATRARLLAYGLAPGEIDVARERVAPMMTEYNAIMWEWVDLGLSDLIAASAAWHRRSAGARLRRADAFYCWAMELADRPRCVPQV